MKKEFKHIGKAARKFDGQERVTGRAVYGHDIELPGMLHASILRAKHPCADILSIDTSKALALDGVECILTADDIDVNNISYKRDHPILKKGTVNCIRDEIAAVAARTKEIADQAVQLIEVEYRVKSGIYDPFEALKDSAPRLNAFGKGEEQFGNKNIAETFHYEHGDLEAEKARSKVIVKRRYHLPRVTHACMGTSNITAEYSPLTGRLTLWASTQVPFLYQRDMAHALKMDASKIRVIQPVIGGGFGSKLDMNPFEPICALLAMKTGKPVQLLYSREEEFLASPTRQTMVIDLTTGADADGRFTFREVEIIKDNGAYTSWGATTPFVMMQTFSSLYQVPACKFDSQAVYTNNPNAGSFRGYGNPQATFALERNIDLMAEELDMGKAELRMLNANYQGEVTGQRLNYKSCGALEALQTAVEESGYHRKAAAPKQGRYRRGIGLASMLHVGGGAKIYRSDGCGTTLKLDDYGYLTIITGSNEIGQGSETVLVMMAMEELGIDRDKIKVINTDTDVKPWDVGVHASRTSFVAGNSLLGTIRLLKEKLNQKAAELLAVEPGDGDYEAGMIRLQGKEIKMDKVAREIHFTAPYQLCEVNYFYEPPSQFQDKEFKGDVSASYAFASQAIEVEVDTLTGNVRVVNAYISQDVGKVLNLIGLQGQIEGGLATGIGYALTEEMIFEEGRLKNPNFHGYKLLTATDMPEVHFYPIETLDGEGPYGAKGASEAPLIPTAPAIANAVANAIGVQFFSLPITAEKVLWALKEQQKAKPVDVPEEELAVPG